MSVFGNSAGCCNQLSSPFASLSSLMGDEEMWYKKAWKEKRAYEENMRLYDALNPGPLKRAIGKRIDGTGPKDQASWGYAYRAVEWGLKQVDFEGVPAKFYYEDEKRQKRVTRLESANLVFRNEVYDAFKVTGQRLPIITVTPPATTVTPPATTASPTGTKEETKKKPEEKKLNVPVAIGGSLLLVGVLYLALRK